MRAVFGTVFLLLGLAGQCFQMWLLYCVVTGFYMETKLCVLLFFPAFIVTYWVNLIFDEIVTTKKETYSGGRSDIVVKTKNTVFPPKVKKIIRIITNVLTVIILALWGYYFVKYSLWDMF